MILLLDIDGVMVPAKSWKSPELLPDGFPAFSVKATSVLQSLINENVTIVLTTSHKSRFTIEEWKILFKNRGIDIASIKSLPVTAENLTRKEDVIHWFETNQIDDDFLILDDDKSLNELPAFLKENLVLTSSMVGLTEEHLEVIQSIADKKLQTVS